MGKIDPVKFWQESARSDRQIAEDLFRLDHYHMSLFMWQLTLEKLLKGQIAKVGAEIIPTHNLLRLAKEAGLDFSEKQKESLAEITTFNIEARYDDYKRRFYKKATKEFTSRWVKICEDFYQLIDSYDQKN